MSSKYTKNKKPISSEEKRISRQRTVLKWAMVIFSILLILSMVLSAVTSY